MFKSVTERVAELVEPQAAKARKEYYERNNVPDESLFWSNPVAVLEGIIEHQLRTKSHQTVTYGNGFDGALGLTMPDVNRIQVTAEVMSDFRDILINQHGQIVINKQGFKPTIDFSHHYLNYLWTHHLQSSAEWTMYQTECNATCWDGAKLTYQSRNAFKLEHVHDGSAIVFNLPSHAESLIHVYYFNTAPTEQVGLRGSMRFKQLFNLMVVGTKHRALVSPCLMQDDDAAPIARPEWRFDVYDGDVTRLMHYWRTQGAVRPQFDGEPRDYLYFANPNDALKFKELLTEAHGSNPYRSLAPKHCIYDSELAAKLKCD